MWWPDDSNGDLKAHAPAYAIVPYVFERTTLSSLMFAFSQSAEVAATPGKGMAIDQDLPVVSKKCTTLHTPGFPLIPHCVTNPGTTRKKPSPS